MGRRPKYGNKIVLDDKGRRFPSIGEMRRCHELENMEALGFIDKLELQPRFRLIVNGQQICCYIADFKYRENGRYIVEDFKGYQTPEFKLKWKLVQALFTENEYRLSRGK